MASMSTLLRSWVQNKLFVRTYERGVGFTNACGTGMSATSLAFISVILSNVISTQEITVFNPGEWSKLKCNN